MSDFKSHREHSKTNWGCTGKPTLDQINAGSLMRIADAAEHMAENHRKLIEENKLLSSSRKSLVQENERLARSNAALRGVITRMKKGKANV